MNRIQKLEDLELTIKEDTDDGKIWMLFHKVADEMLPAWRDNDLLRMVFSRFVENRAWESAAFCLIRNKFPSCLIKLETGTNVRYHHCTLDPEGYDVVEYNNAPTTYQAMLGALVLAVKEREKVSK